MIPDAIRYLITLSRSDQQAINGNLQRLASFLPKLPCNGSVVDEAIEYLKGGYYGKSLLHEDSVIINPVLSTVAYVGDSRDTHTTEVFRLVPNIGETPLLVSSGDLWGIFPDTVKHHFQSIDTTFGLSALSSTIPTDFMLALLLDLLNANN